MAFDPEEFKARREARERERKAKQARQRKTLISLGIAAGVLLVCIAVILLLPSRSNSSETVPTEPISTDPSISTDATEPLPSTEASPNDPTTVIHFTAAGDLNINDTVVSAGSFSYDYSLAFQDVVPVLSQANLTVLNLEGNLVGAPYGSQTASAPQTMMQALHDAGVDMIQLANSYSIHNGMGGLVSTMRSVRNAGMEPLGVYESNAAFKEVKGYTIRNVQGVKIALVAFTKGMDGLALPAGNEKCVNVLYKDYESTYQSVNTAGITSVLNAVSKENPDITIALLHWGSEFNDTISSTQKSICSLMLQNGVDAIIGTHPHYVQQISYDQEAGTLIAYSLGDFFSDAQRAGSEYSIVLDLEITKDNRSGTTRITNYSYTPIFSVVEEGKLPRVVRIAEAMFAYENLYIDRVTEDTYDDMAYALKRIEARVKGE